MLRNSNHNRGPRRQLVGDSRLFAKEDSLQLDEPVSALPHTIRQHLLARALLRGNHQEPDRPLRQGGQVCVRGLLVIQHCEQFDQRQRVRSVFYQVNKSH